MQEASFSNITHSTHNCQTLTKELLKRMKVRLCDLSFSSFFSLSPPLQNLDLPLALPSHPAGPLHRQTAKKYI